MTPDIVTVTVPTVPRTMGIATEDGTTATGTSTVASAAATEVRPDGLTGIDAARGVEFFLLV